MNTIRSPAPGAAFFNLGSSFNTRKNNGLMGAMNSVATNIKNVVSSNSNTQGPSMTHIILFTGLIIVVIVFGVFWRQISQGISVAYDRFRAMIVGKTAPPPEENPEYLPPPVTEKPEAPQDAHNKTSTEKLVEKVLPGRNEVFNISKNSYTYYDAEPLCKALGAELATYEQVKQAYAQGADWCNYGWTKGQMAVYPTQKDTWESLQSGPEEQRNSCGRPGLNGGFFDNPELQFGVNCYGVKPDQKDHDATNIAAGQGAPLSPGGLDVEKKIAKYRGEANSIAVLPWNKQNWSS